jgi:hypothetical protein
MGKPMLSRKNICYSPLKATVDVPGLKYTALAVIFNLFTVGLLLARFTIANSCVSDSQTVIAESLSTKQVPKVTSFACKLKGGWPNCGEQQGRLLGQ